MSACGGDGESSAPIKSEAVASVILTPENMQLQVGISANLTVQTLGASTNVLVERLVTWSSSDVAIATVSNSGVIQPLSPGLIQITATSEGVSDTIYVDVYINRTTAILSIREQIVDELKSLRAVIGLMTVDPLPIGTVITVSGELTPRTVFEFDSPSYFSLVDPMPTSKFGHKVEFVMIDARTGAISREIEFDLPTVNGELYWYTLEDRLMSNERFEPETNEQVFGPILLEPLVWENEVEENDRSAFGFSPLFMSNYSLARRSSYAKEIAGKLVGVVVAAASDAEIIADAKNMGDVMEKYGFTVERFNSENHTLANVIAGIKKAAEGLGPEDKFMLYISSHTELNDDNNDNKPDKNRALRLDYAKGSNNETKWSIMNYGRSSQDLPRLLAEIKAGTINLVVDACYAESIIVNMTNGVRRGSVPFVPQTEQNIHVFASSASDLTSEGASILETIGSYLGGEIGSTYTETIIQNLNGARAGADIDGDGVISPTEFESVFQSAHDKTEGTLNQKPKSKTFSGAPAPEVSKQIEDSSQDTFACNSGEPVFDSAVDITGVNISRTAKTTSMDVVMAQSPTESFTDYSFAVLVSSADFNALVEIHAGEEQQGILDSDGFVVPETESTASVGSNAVTFFFPQGTDLPSGPPITIRTFHTQSEGGDFNCDEITFDFPELP